jgi:hypothetical protein
MISFVRYLNYWRKKEKIFPTYLLISQIVESERGNKQYFNLGLTAVTLMISLDYIMISPAVPSNFSSFF